LSSKNLSTSKKTLLLRRYSSEQEIPVLRVLTDRGTEFYGVTWDIFNVFKESHILDLPIPEDFGGKGAVGFMQSLNLDILQVKVLS